MLQTWRDVMTMYFVDVKNKTKEQKKKIYDKLKTKYGVVALHTIWTYNCDYFVWVDSSTGCWQHLDVKRLYSSSYVPRESVNVHCPCSVTNLGEM